MKISDWAKFDASRLSIFEESYARNQNVLPSTSEMTEPTTEKSQFVKYLAAPEKSFCRFVAKMEPSGESG